MKKELSISVVVPILNSETTIIDVLDSLKKQKYPIKEIIVVDNHSSDKSVKRVEEYIKKNKRMNIQLIRRFKTYTPGSSYNLAVKKAKGEFIVALHSDSILPTNSEISKLLKPFELDKEVVATYPLVEHNRKIWEDYPFWQKCQFVHVQGTKKHAMLGKFDAYRKNVYQQVGGFDDKNFIPGIGSEDAELYFRLRKIGKITKTNAVVIHLHYMGQNYSLRNWVQNRKLMARTYGRLLRLNWRDVRLGSLVFFIKPVLALGILIPRLHALFLIASIIFVLFYMRGMYTDKITRYNPRILILPFISIFLLYYETFWMAEAFLKKKKKV